VSQSVLTGKEGSIIVPSSQTILLVDDDADLRETLAEGLEAAGYRVIQAEDVRQVMTRLTLWKPTVAILDLVLAHESGAALVAYIKRHPLLKQTRVIMMSGFEHGAQTAKTWGADRFLRKPVTIRDLLNAIREPEPDR
jgi:DNA-binding response OmpR family regulator